MSSANPAAGEVQRPLSGNMLWLAALVLAAANFMVVLDTTIANVSVPNIAGGWRYRPARAPMSLLPTRWQRPSSCR
ncbi:Multidrug resistance protein B [Chromobacterium violaceum]|uniref:Multidrug resistance protein B n=1 Tax=Chromobacterium violaceum TaxID=536 RepID=A0A3S4ICN3_CHRVL|nr:Multidrug resistance protein B [Chromobacterium violaceum]